MIREKIFVVRHNQKRTNSGISEKGKQNDGTQ